MKGGFLQTFLQRFRSAVACVTALVFTLSLIITPNISFAQNVVGLNGMAHLSAPTEAFVPVSLRALKVRPNEALVFDLIVDSGNATVSQADLKKETAKLAKYFLAALTVPEKDLWVNISPYEHDRIIPELFGQTDMGRDLLAQDYILKQLSASLLNPKTGLGQEFWSRVYSRAKAELGTTEIPADTFNKVWIVPSQAVVYEHDGMAIVGESHLKVMLAEDYLAMSWHKGERGASKRPAGAQESGQMSRISTELMRTIIIPEIEQEVNSGSSFAALRQIYQALILAVWYKENLKESLLMTVYADQNKIDGLDIADKGAKDKIYEQYMAAFRQGVFNFIKEDVDPLTGDTIPRKYFSGGAELGATRAVLQRRSMADAAMIPVEAQKASGELSQATIALTAASGLIQRPDPVWGANARQFDIYAIADQLELFQLEKDMLPGVNGAGDIDELMRPDVVPSVDALQEVFDALNGAPVRTINGTQSEAEKFEIYLRKKGMSLQTGGVSQVPLTADFYLEIKTERIRFPIDSSAPGLREQIKFGTVLNAVAKDKADFIKVFGQANERYYEAFRLMFVEYAGKVAERKADGIILRGLPEDFQVFRNDFNAALRATGLLTESVDRVIAILKEDVDRFVDLNDILVEMANENVLKGNWSYDTAVKLLFLEQMRVGVVSKNIVRDLSSPEQAVYLRLKENGYSFGVQFNPNRELRALTGAPLPGETVLSKSFMQRNLPLERGIGYFGHELQYNILPNPFPHLRNSINVVMDEEAFKVSQLNGQDAGVIDGVPPQVPYRSTIEDMLGLLLKFTPDHPRYERFRLFLNARFAGQSFDHLHYQGFAKRTVVEDVLQGDKLRQIAADQNGVQYYTPKELDTYWFSSVVVVKGKDIKNVAAGVEKVLSYANLHNKTVAIVKDSKFTYNILFTHDGRSFKVFVFLRKVAASEMLDKDQQKQFHEPVIALSNDLLPPDGKLLSRPAAVELVDTLILDKRGLDEKFAFIKAHPEILPVLLEQISRQIKYDESDFRILTDDLSRNMPLPPGAVFSETDAAQNLGGIDFDPARLNLKVERTGSAVSVQVDPLEIQRIKMEGVNGFTPVIINIVPIATIVPMVKIKEGKVLTAT